jgi:hypothetical protein
MTAAELLAAWKVDVVALEAREATSTDPNAISIDDESLRTNTDAVSATLEASDSGGLRRGRSRPGLACGPLGMMRP